MINSYALISCDISWRTTRYFTWLVFDTGYVQYNISYGSEMRTYPF